MRDEAVVVAADHVDAIDRYAVYDGFEFKHRRVFAMPLADIFEVGIAQSVASGGEIFRGDRFALLRQMHHRTFKHAIVMQDCGDCRWVAR